MLWAKLVKEKFEPKKEKSLMLRTHCQVSAASAAKRTHTIKKITIL